MSTSSKTKLTIAAFAVAVLTACGGGDGASAVESPGSFTVESGVAQKGPLAQGSVVTVDELTSTTLQPNGKEYTFRTNNNLGTFSTRGITFGSSYLSTLASGYYFNEITGAQSNDIVVLSGLSQVGTGGDTVINVNALSSMAVNRVTKLATVAPVQTFAAARAQAQRELLAAFYIYNGTGILTGTTINNIAQPANLTALDLSKSRAGDQMLAAMSGVVMTAGINGNGVNTLLSQIAVDLGDDGLLNNSTNYRTSVQSKLCAAAAVTDFATVATNLNALYSTSYSANDLSQWVDTSGCVDQVINKYKFSASNVAVGTISKSPAYTIGADDIGQCFSVGGVTAGATAALYYNGAATSVVGTQLVKAGDSVAIGANASTAGSFSGYIQRSAPVANGTCPAVVPTTSLTRVEKYTVDYQSYTVSTLAGSGQKGNADAIGVAASFNWPVGVAVDATGAVYVADMGNNKIRKITQQGVVTTFAGTGQQGDIDGMGQNASFNGPIRVAVDLKGNIYIADVYNHKIRKITPEGLVTTVLIDTKNSVLGADSVAVDNDGNVYIAESYGNIIRKVTSQGLVTTLAGNGQQGSLDGPGTSSSFYHPTSIAVDASGLVYVADTYNNKIRKITPQGVVTTLAGSGNSGGADGMGASASFTQPNGVAVDISGNVYVADSYNNKIRKITQQGRVTTIAGNGQGGSQDGVGAVATFSQPISIAVDSLGTVYVADFLSNKIRMIK